MDINFTRFNSPKLKPFFCFLVRTIVEIVVALTYTRFEFSGLPLHAIGA